MKTLSEKEFNGLNIKVMFTEKVEQAKKELSPLMQEIRKYMPQAEYGYHVVSGEYPAFYGVRIEFTYNGIRFHVYKINKENKYKIAADMEHFEYVNRYDIERAGSQYEKPCFNLFDAQGLNLIKLTGVDKSNFSLLNPKLFTLDVETAADGTTYVVITPNQNHKFRNNNTNN